MSQEAVRYGNGSTALVTLEQASAEIDKIVEESIPFAVATSANFSASLKLAEAVGTLREIFHKHPGIKKTVEAMKDTKLGFLTDKSPKAMAYAKSQGKTVVPYTYEEITECCIEAMLNGYRITNNEFNVIAGGFYAAKNGKYRKIVDNPDVTDFKFTTTSPMYSPDGKSAKVQCFASWMQKSQLVTLGTSDKDKGKEDTLVFTVRVNSAMGEDAVVGKAISKLFSRVLMRLSGKIMSEATDVEFAEIKTPDGGRTLAIDEGNEKTSGPIYDIKGELGPQSPHESAATTPAGSGEGKEVPPPETPQPPETKPPKAKTLFENLMAARGTFCKMVTDNLDAIQNILSADELLAVKERWNGASIKGLGGVTKGAPWPIPETKEEKPLFETEEEEKTEEGPVDAFLSKVEEYRKELNSNTWNLILKISGMTHAPISEIPEGEPRVRFLERCSRSLDQQNQKGK